MALWLQLDWAGIFLPQAPLEVILRGTVMYLSLFVLLRIILKRQAGNISLTDMLLVVLIGDASQNAMARDHYAVADGLLLVGAIVFWDYCLDWLSYRIPRLRHWVQPSPLLLVHDGLMVQQNMRQEMLSEDELKSKLREKGVNDLAIVEKAYMEGDGRISVITKEQPRAGSARKRRRRKNDTAK